MNEEENIEKRDDYDKGEREKDGEDKQEQKLETKGSEEEEKGGGE